MAGTRTSTPRRVPQSWDSLIALLDWRADHEPDRVVYTWSGDRHEQTATSLDIAKRSRPLAGALISRTSPGDRVLILHQQGPEYLISLFACLYAGCIAVPLYPPRGDRLDTRVDSVVADSGAVAALTGSATVERLARAPRDQPITRLRLIATDAGIGDEDVSPRRAPDNVAILQYTSGSTSAPRGVVLTNANLLHNIEHIGRRFGESPESVGVIWLPPFHDMGLIGGLLAPLHGGFPVTLLSPRAFLHSPVKWLHTISRVGATTSGGPNFAYDLCTHRVTDAQMETLDLSTWRVAFNGAEPVRSETLSRFSDRFAACGFRPEAFYPCYGLAEATLLVTGGDREKPPVVRPFDRDALREGAAVPVRQDAANAQTLVGCGRALDDQQVVIVDPTTGCPAADGAVGEVWVGGPSVAARYWNESASAESFGRTLPDRPGRFLRTGDHGFLHDGELFITGRRSDLLVFRGRNHYAVDVELTACEAHAALRPGGSAAFAVTVGDEDRLVLVHELERIARQADVAEVAGAVRAAVSDEHELQVYGVVLVKPGAVPRTTSNKVQRGRCRELFLSDSLDVLGISMLDLGERSARAAAAPSREFLTSCDRTDAVTAVAGFLRTAAAGVLGVRAEALCLDSTLAQLGLDSVAGLELAHAIEENLEIVVPPSVALGPTPLRNLAAWVADEVRGGRTADPDANAVEDDGRPLTYGQEGLWLLSNLAPESSAYNVAGAVRIMTALDVARLQRAVEHLVERHSSLRTTYRPGHDGCAVPVVGTDAAGVFRSGDARPWDDDQVRRRVAAVANRPFDLERGPVVRVQVFTRSAAEHWLVLACHQIAADFWSLELLARELGDLYSSDTPHAAPAPAGPNEAAARERRLLDGPSLDRLRSYWSEQLRPPLPRTELPADRARPAVQSLAGGTVRFVLDQAVADGVKALAEGENTTPFVVLLAAYAALMSRYTAADDVVIGTPAANRSRHTGGAVGFLANTLALRIEVGKAGSFRELLGRTRRSTLDALDYQSYPFSLVVRDVERRRDPSRSPVFQTMFVLQRPREDGDAAMGALALGQGGVPGALGDLVFESVELDRAGSQFDLTLMMAEAAGGYAGTLTYDRDLFAPTTTGRLARQFAALIEAAIENPLRPPGRLRVSGEHEQHAAVALWRRPRPPRGAPVHRVAAAAAAATPAAVAVVDEAGECSYAELLQRAAAIARSLPEDAGGGVPVAILLAPGRDAIAAMLGVLAAGRAFLPLDMAWPPARIADIVRSAGCATVLTDEAHRGHLLDSAAAVLVEQARAAGPLPAIDIPLEATACVYATSGTTSTPRLVAISHGSLSAQAAGMSQVLGITAADRQLLVESLAFAAAIRQVLVPLTVGAAVVLAPSGISDTGSTMDLAVRSGATVLSATPSMLRQWAEALAETTPNNHMRLVLSASEDLSWQTARTVSRCFPSARLANLFGHTEAAGIAMATWLDEVGIDSAAPHVAAGPAVGAAEAFALDDDLHPVPDGMPGMLYIGGPVVAEGYVGDPAGTAASFIPHPYGLPGERLFRTGDVVRHRNGRFEFLGRHDAQIKVRGNRIEPRDVELVLDRHPGVRSSIVIGVEGGGETRLAAYVLHRGEMPTASELRRHAAEWLPTAFVPSLFVPVEEWPLGPTGKIDRRALPAPGRDRPVVDTVFVLPRTPLEERLAAIWIDVLPVDRVGVDDNFFDVGGTSIDAMAVHRRMTKELAADVRLVTLFQYPTVAAMARFLTDGQPVSRHMQSGRSAAARRRERLSGATPARTSRPS